MAVLAITGALVVIVLVPFFLMGREVEDVMGSGKAPLKRESALSAEAFAFLTPGDAAELERNPFKVKLKAPEPPKPKPVPKKEAPKVVEKPVEKPAEKPVEPKPEKVEPPAPQPQMAYQIVPGVILFTFQQMNSTGKTVAILSAQSKGTAAQTYTLGVGEEVNGATILAISEEALLVRDARNRRIAIPLGTKKQLWMKTMKEQ